MKRKKSIKTRVAIVLMEMIIPLILFIICFNFYTINILNTRISESNQNTLKSYCNNIEDTLQILQNRMINFISLNTNFIMLSQKSSDINAHTQSYEIMKEYRSLIDTYPLICGCFIYSNSSSVYREVYRGSFTGVNLKDKLREHFLELTKDQEKILEKSWKPLVIDGRHFLYLIKGYRGCFCIYLIDLDSIPFVQNTGKHSTNCEMILYQKDTLLTVSPAMKENQIQLKGTDTYYFTGSPQKYMIIERPLKFTSIRAAYLAEYRGILGNLSYLQSLVFFVSLLSILMIPYGYHKLKHVFFKPMNTLVKTMNEIKEGKLEARVNTDYTEIEFLEVNNTFNSMIEQINTLKIDSYEKELRLKKTQLQYYQIQIKPHFYINCLKSMYGMMEEEKYEDTKKSIILLSNHLRYMLKNTSMIVTIDTELDYIKNYMALWQLSMAYPPECKVDVDPELTKIMIPAVSVLSFVENCIKHAVNINKALCVGIQIHSVQTEEGTYLNIHVSDNGAGFPEEQIKYLNNYLNNQQPDQSIGIYNVIQRYLLYYGEGNVWFAFSNMNGSHIDIYIKLEQA
jgi:Predicted signal transduction protein with a C-terminal ATPase domain